MKNEYLQIQIVPKGAEIKSVIDLQSGNELMWQANPEVWGRTAPILFPIVGKVKNNQLLIDGSAYPMGQHGFARDAVFTVLKESAVESVYQLASSPQTLLVYPYHFELEIRYTLHQRTLDCNYTVRNTQHEPMYFSIGAHPGFAIPNNELSACELVFEKPELASRMLLSQGLFDGRSQPILNNENTLPLNTSLFDDDAIVLHHLQSNTFRLQKIDTSFNIQITTRNLPDLGIWTQNGSSAFVCIEPWSGYADSVEGHDDISTKPGMLKLQAGETFTCGYAITFNS